MERKTKDTNYVGRYLTKSLSGYGLGVYSDLGRVLEVTGGAVGLWARDNNGVGHVSAQKISILLDVTLDVMVNNMNYATPASNTRLDKEVFLVEALHLLEGVKNHAFRMDLKRNLTKAQLKINPPRTISPRRMVLGSLKELGEHVGPQSSCDARPGLRTPVSVQPYTPGERQAKAEIPTKIISSGLAPPSPRDIIKTALASAEVLRERHDIEWYVKDDGNLGAIIRERL
jgi:hypothetical protein